MALASCMCRCHIDPPRSPEGRVEYNTVIKLPEILFTFGRGMIDLLRAPYRGRSTVSASTVVSLSSSTQQRGTIAQVLCHFPIAPCSLGEQGPCRRIL